MIKTISPSKIKGSVKAPASKSFMQRAIALAILANQEMVLENPSTCKDGLAAIDIARKFGFEVEEKTSFLEIKPGTKGTPNTLNCGEAGLGIRMFTPLAALNNYAITLQGEGSLLTRPLAFMEETLSQLGVKVQTNKGLPPITVEGPVLGGEALVDGSTSSQFLTGLLIALPQADHDTTLKVDALKSIPYIDMTLAAVQAFGGEITHDNYQTFYIKGKQNYSTKTYFIEGDWSGAAGLLIAGAIAGDIEVTQLQAASTQADKAVLEALSKAGVTFTEANDTYTVKKATQLSAFEMDATHCPDLFPVLAALAANCQGTSRIKGIHRLRHKESDRALTVQEEFAKLGIPITFEKDEMLITGGTIKGAEVFAHNDHRIAFAMAIAALNATGPVSITGAECVSKSYPEFFEDLETLQA